MSKALDSVSSPHTHSLITHPSSQIRLAAEMPWWGWVAVGVAMLMAGLMVWYLWPRKPHPEPDLPRDTEGRLIPPWKWKDLGIRPPGDNA